MFQKTYNATPILTLLFLLSGYSNNLVMLVLTAGLCVYTRAKSFWNMFVKNEYDVWDVVNSISSHVLLFSSLYIIFGTEYTRKEPAGDLIDSIYYSMDTLTTNGTGRNLPNTGRTIMIHILNLLDTYLLFITLGFYIINIVKRNPRETITATTI
jgi:hypothetical protein